MSSRDDYSVIHNEDSQEPCECQDCDWEGAEADVLPIRNLADRITPGEICPVGECPACGALVHYKDDEDWSNVDDGRQGSIDHMPDSGEEVDHG